jgi:hypothetical protein
MSYFLLSPNIIRVVKSREDEVDGYVERTEEVRYAYKILVGGPEGKGKLG